MPRHLVAVSQNSLRRKAGSRTKDYRSRDSEGKGKDEAEGVELGLDNGIKVHAGAAGSRPGIKHVRTKSQSQTENRQRKH